MGGSANGNYIPGKNAEWHGNRTGNGMNAGQMAQPRGNAYGFNGLRPPQAQGQPPVEDTPLPNGVSMYQPGQGGGVDGPAGQWQDTGFSGNPPQLNPGMFPQRPPITAGSFDMSQAQNLPAYGGQMPPGGMPGSMPQVQTIGVPGTPNLASVGDMMRRNPPGFKPPAGIPGLGNNGPSILGGGNPGTGRMGRPMMVPNRFRNSRGL